MGLLDQLAGALSQYENANPAQPPPSVESDFDKAAQNSPQAVAEGVSHAFRSDQTPSFGQMASQLFSHANPQQKNGILSTLLSSLGPSASGQLGNAGGGIANLLNAFKSGNLSESSAQQVSPQDVHQLAEQAEQQNPSVVDQVSHFVSQHPTLVKTLGATALTVILSKMARSGR